MINIIDKAKCCGCTACANICPNQCIEMKADEEGFLYPAVRKNLCSNCGLCEKICPIHSNQSFEERKRESYVLRTKDKETLLQSTSGGFTSPIIEWIKNNNGLVCGATYADDFTVQHELVKASAKGVEKFKGSKYVQSNLNSCFTEIKSALQSGEWVLFVGTTCQVAGLKAFLCKDFETLITVDLVCHGTPSPKLWKKYIEYQQQKYNSNIAEVSFRNKTYGYHSGTMKIVFQNGKEYYGSARVDFMLKSFFSEISSRPSCYGCSFKQMERCSDFTIYDCWHASQLVDGLKDDDSGYTNVIVQSEKGRWLFDQIKDSYISYPVDTDMAINLDGIMVNRSAIPHAKRKEYYKELDNECLPKHIQRFIPIRKKDYIIESVKEIAYRFGIYNQLKKLLK